MEKDTINICIASTCNEYLKIAAPFLESFYEHMNCEYKYHLYFLSNDIISEESKNKLFYKKIENFEVTFIHIDEKKIFWKYENLKNRLNIILYRWLMADYINEDKVLFMDHDTIVRWDISELYFTNLWDMILWACKDPILRENPILKEYDVKEYFNAGIQLVNLKKWREKDIKNKALNFLNDNIKRLSIPDQDTLNIICKNNWFCLSPKWNSIVVEWFHLKRIQYTQNEYKESLKPLIIHYTWFFHKPRKWIICLHPDWSLYFRYLKKTKYRESWDFKMYIQRCITSNIVTRYAIKSLLYFWYWIKKHLWSKIVNKIIKSAY